MAAKFTLATGAVAVWHGGPVVEYYKDGTCMDAVHLPYKARRWTQLDALQAVLQSNVTNERGSK